MAICVQSGSGSVICCAKTDPHLTRKRYIFWYISHVLLVYYSERDFNDESKRIIFRTWPRVCQVTSGIRFFPLFVEPSSKKYFQRNMLVCPFFFLGLMYLHMPIWLPGGRVCTGSAVGFVLLGGLFTLTILPVSYPHTGSVEFCSALMYTGWYLVSKNIPICIWSRFSLLVSRIPHMGV